MTVRKDIVTIMVDELDDPYLYSYVAIQCLCTQMFNEIETFDMKKKNFFFTRKHSNASPKPVSETKIIDQSKNVLPKKHNNRDQYRKYQRYNRCITFMM